jgi:hypothetical protein
VKISGKSKSKAAPKTIFTPAELAAGNTVYLRGNLVRANRLAAAEVTLIDNHTVEMAVASAPELSGSCPIGYLLICHVPPGTLSKAVTMCIPEADKVYHLPEYSNLDHGQIGVSYTGFSRDHEGACLPDHATVNLSDAAVVNLDHQMTMGIDTLLPGQYLKYNISLFPEVSLFGLDFYWLTHGDGWTSDWTYSLSVVPFSAAGVTPAVVGRDYEAANYGLARK